MLLPSMHIAPLLLLLPSISTQIIYTDELELERPWNVSIVLNGTEQFIHNVFLRKSFYSADVNPAEIIDVVISGVNAFTPVLGSFGLPHANVISGLGTIASYLNGVASGTKPNAIANQLKILSNKLDGLSRQMASGFTNIINIMIKHHFSTSINERLNSKDSNILKWAMESDPSMTNATFFQTKNMVYSVLHELVILQSFYGGLKSSTAEELQDAIRYANKLLVDSTRNIDKLFNNYKVPYWPKVVQNIIEEAQREHSALSYPDFADYIKKKLLQIQTTDQFYIMVYAPVVGFQNHMMQGHFVSSFRKGGCNVVVSRSIHAHKIQATDAKLNSIKSELEKYNRGKDDHEWIFIRNPDELKAPVTTIFNLIKPGFLWVVAEVDHFMRDDRYAIRWTGPLEWGPGWHLGRLSSGDLKIFAQRGRSVWLAFYHHDFNQMNTLAWRIHYEKMVFIAPTMLISIQVRDVLSMYNLDLNNLVYKKADYKKNASGARRFFLDSYARGGFLMMDAQVDGEHRIKHTMLFLILLGSLIPFISASVDEDAGKQYYHEHMKQFDYVRRHYLKFDNCSVGQMNYETYPSLGIPERTYELKEYNSIDYGNVALDRLVMKYQQGKTYKQAIQLAKDEHPELTKEINHFVAVSVWKPYVYLVSTLFEVIEKRKCVINGVCKMFLELKVEDLILKFGSETKETLKTSIELFDGSKVLDLYCNYECVENHYKQWIQHCTQISQPSAAGVLKNSQ